MTQVAPSPSPPPSPPPPPETIHPQDDPGTLAQLLMTQDGGSSSCPPHSTEPMAYDASQAGLIGLRPSSSGANSSQPHPLEQVVISAPQSSSGPTAAVDESLVFTSLFEPGDGFDKSDPSMAEAHRMLTTMERQWIHVPRPKFYLRPGTVQIKNWSQQELLGTPVGLHTYKLSQLPIRQLRSRCQDDDISALLQQLAPQSQSVWGFSAPTGFCSGVRWPIKLYHHSLDSVTAWMGWLWSQREESDWLYLAMLRPLPSLQRLMPLYPGMFRLRVLHHLMARIVPDLVDNHFNWRQLENKQAELLGDCVATWLSCCSIRNPAQIRTYILALLDDMEHSIWLRQACGHARNGMEAKILPTRVKAAQSNRLQAAEMGVVVGSLFAGIEKYVASKTKRGVQRFYWFNKLVQFVFACGQILPEVVDSQRLIKGAAVTGLALVTLLLTTVLEQIFPICEWQQLTRSMRGELRLKMEKAIGVSQRYDSHVMFRWMDTVLECNGVR